MPQVAGFKTQHISSKGFSAALNDLPGGQVNMFMESVATALPRIQACKLRALAVKSAGRSPQLPDVPTIVESGYPGFLGGVTWIGIVAPAEILQDVFHELNKEINTALKSKDYSDRLRVRGAVVPGGHRKSLNRRSNVIWMSGKKCSRSLALELIDLTVAG
ncbi:tripartite tricarboxylate transporter substrate-binding protein [Orrella marina]|uniref:Uncharacterized protein n=1 Tax=Orrella marina TaxID=2163011 RepID=A0A2R4XHI8_9BURK|nr:tripartite tricarboxylate transporter substrate-binding protein [Orrella marina]AWB33288.1 hypothetical protein DBV39_05750 [Orrella marina]